MSYAAEPYGVFVDDLLSSLTGGITREEFRYPALKGVPQLSFGADHVPSTVRIHGLVDGEFLRFEAERDYLIEENGEITWLGAAEGAPSAAQLPDSGSYYYASYERRPENRGAPLLTDRNPGSVVRTLAESFAREYAVVSKQLEKVYRSAFLETAEGRDLEQVAALVGVSRRGRLFASGEVVFSRSTPATGDIAIPEGTLISTSDAPPLTVESVEARTLRAGSLSVAVPVQSLLPGPEGVVLERQLSVIHRPILGIERVENTLPLSFSGGDEDDTSLRRRAARALESSGKSTVGALVGALTTIEGIRERDVRVKEDHVNHPGLIKVTIASDLTSEQAARAVELIEATRPAGIKVLHNLTPVTSMEAPAPLSGGGPLMTPPELGVAEGTWFFIEVHLKVVPASSGLSNEEKLALVNQALTATSAVFDALSIGEPVIYNRLIAAAMGVPGIHDVFLEVFPKGASGGRSNIIVPENAKARLLAEDLAAETTGSLVALDVEVEVSIGGRLLLQDREQARSFVRDDISDKLDSWLRQGQPVLNQALLKGRLPDSDEYALGEFVYTAEFLAEGVRLLRENTELELEIDQQAWLRSLNVVVTSEDGA
jgi:uncharacterized phage protein gp47/JayE